MDVGKISKYKITGFEWILIGLTIYMLGGIFEESMKLVSKLLVLLGLLIVFFNAYFIMSQKSPFKGVVQSVFFFYLLWSLFIILRPFISQDELAMSIYTPMNVFGWLSFTTPLIVFLGFRQLSLRSVFKFTYLYGLVGIVLLVINYREIFTVEHVFVDEEYQKYIGVAGIPTTFLSISSYVILFYAFVQTKYKSIGFLSIFVYLLTALYVARRSEVFTILIILLFTFYLFIFSSEKGSKVLKLFFVLCVIGIGIATFYIYSNSTFSFFLTRMSENTRTGVENLFFKSFKGETLDWIIGRGIGGTYYCPISDSNYRTTIETGYLYIILKGGLVSLALFLYLLLYSAYLGFFRSKNMLTKAMASYLVIHVILLVPFGLPAFSIEYVFVWICVMYCQSETWRMKSDTFINGYLYRNERIEIMHK